MAAIDEYLKYKEFTDQQAKQIYQCYSASNDYDPLIRNVAIYTQGKHICTLETHTLPDLIEAITLYQDTL